MDERTSMCPTCGQRAPQDVVKMTDKLASVVMWMAAGVGLIGIGLFGFFIGLGVGILSVPPIGFAVLSVEQHRHDRAHGRWRIANAKVVGDR